MIRVTVAYPKTDDSTFDLDYYLNSHMPMVRDRLGDALLDESIWRGVGDAGGGPPAYEVVLHMHFESVEAFGSAMGAHAREIMGDVPNYTNVQPLTQIQEPV